MLDVKTLYVRGRCCVRIAMLVLLTNSLYALDESPNLRDPEAAPIRTEAAQATTRPPPSAGTQAMVERLGRLNQQADPTKNLYISDRRVDMLRRNLRQTHGLTEILSVQVTLAGELLVAGKPAEAIQMLEQIRKTIRERNLDLTENTLAHLLDLEAICYFRLGEVQNCIARHGVDSCLFPIQGGGIHVDRQGSLGAIERLTQALKKNPTDLSSRWLLNLAYMTLGQHPDEVPKQWLIPSERFDSDFELPRFFDVAGGLGLDVVGLSGGCVVEDFDADGYLDIMVSGWGLNEQIQFFHNNGDGSFTNRTSAAGLIGIVGGLNLCHADYNNDGFPDVLVLRGAWLAGAGRHPNSLLRNNGDGTFDDVTEEAGLLSFYPTPTATWGDFDNDGWIDLFIGIESNAGVNHPCELFRNNGDGTFTECASQMGVAHRGFVKGVAFGDYDNDGRLDLYVSCLGQPNALYHNDGPQATASAESRRLGIPAWKFTDVAAQAGVRQPLYGFPIWFWDYNNDGWQDILVFGYHWRDVGDVAADYLGLPQPAEKPRLYLNNRDGTFSNVTKQVGLDTVLMTMGCNFGDLDNDGWLDFYAGTGTPNMNALVPNRMFRNHDGTRFGDVTSAGGFGHLQKGHGIAFVDLDNDGDQDIYQVLGGAYTGDTFPNVLFENPGNDNHWITLKLVGSRSSRDAIGTRIRLRLETAQGERLIYATVGTGGSFGSGSLQQEIGLGQATAIRAIEIYWPTSGINQVFHDVPMDHMYRIKEGLDELHPLDLARYDLSPN